MPSGTLRVRSLGPPRSDDAESRRRHSDAERRNEGLRSGGGDQRGFSTIRRMPFRRSIPSSCFLFVLFVSFVVQFSAAFRRSCVAIEGSGCFYLCPLPSCVFWFPRGIPSG